MIGPRAGFVCGLSAAEAILLVLATPKTRTAIMEAYGKLNSECYRYSSVGLEREMVYIPLTYSNSMQRYDRVVVGWTPERHRSMHAYIGDGVFKVQP